MMVQTVAQIALVICLIVDIINPMRNLIKEFRREMAPYISQEEMEQVDIQSKIIACTTYVVLIYLAFFYK